MGAESDGDHLPDSRVDITSSKGVYVGDHGVQVNLLLSGSQPALPLVVGNIPQQPLALQPRDDLMRELRAAGPGVSVVRVVTGMRGVGKTQLAAAYARECVNSGWRLVAWVNAADATAVLNDMAVIADRWGIDRTGRTLEDTGLQVRNRLEADGERCLIVFDNVTDVDTLRAYVPSVGACQVIVTTTERTGLGPRRLLQVGVFTEAEALAYLTERTESDEVEDACALAEDLGFLPLALAQAGAVVRAQHLSYRVYLARLRAYPTQKYLPRAKGDPYPHGVAEAILLSLDALKTADPRGYCSLFLDMMSLLSPAEISRELLYLLIKDGQGIDEELSHLEIASLINFNGDASSVMIHPLVARVSRERARHVGKLTGIVRLACQFLRFCQRYIGDDPWSNPLATREIIRHVNALHDHLTSPLLSSDEPAELLRLRCWALMCLLELRDSPLLAVEHAESLVRDCDRTLGESDRDSIAAWNNLASAYQYSGRDDEAVELLQNVLSKYEIAFGRTHVDALKAMNNLALAYQRVGRLDESIALHEKEVSETERQLGGSHPQTMASESNLALAYRAAGRLDEAILLFERVLGKREKYLATNHPDTLASRHNLATAYGYAGRRAEAFLLHERVLDESEKILGGSHPDTLSACNSLACAYTEAGLWSEAIPFFERALSGLEAGLGYQHPLTLAVRKNLEASRQRAGQ